MSESANGPVGRALVLHPVLKTAAQDRGNGAGGGELRLPEARLEEAVGLAQAINLEVAGAEVLRLSKPRPATLIGKGMVDLLAPRIEEAQIGVVVIDAPVTPVQQRNLEKEWQCKVIDRTGLILEIFGARARTHEGRLQVELAALTYQRSRLVRSWTHLERQRGGFGFLGGPGESQLEIDRRLIGERITRLKRELETTKRTRELHRKARNRVPYPVIALVGYTNAGKSTLFNRLTRSEVFARDLLFATLDPTMRLLDLPSGRKAILSDTVGFISDLPTMLVAAFRATLEEVLEADLVVHVRDIHHPDTEAQRADVHRVLGELGLADLVAGGLIEALNKLDLLDDEHRQAVLARAGGRNPGDEQDLVPLSAATGAGCEALLQLFDRRLGSQVRPVEYHLSHDQGGAIAWLYAHGEVLDRHDDERHAHLTVNLSPTDRARFESRKPEGVAALSSQPQFH